MLKHLRTHMRWIMIAIAAAFLLSTFLMYDSGRGSRSAPSSDGTMQDYVVATVNGQDLMRSTLESMFRNYVMQSDTRNITSVDVPYLYKAALDNAIFTSELEKEVAARNVSVSDAEITEAVNIMADNFPTREAFYQYLERSGIKMEALRKDVARQISTNKTIEIAVGNPVISDDEVLKFYNQTKAIFYAQPKGFMFDVANFLTSISASIVRVRMGMSDADWNEVLSSDIPSADIIRKTDEPAFVSEMFLSADEKMRPLLTIKVGEVSPIIEISSNDFFVGVKREEVDEKETPFDEVSGDIRNVLEGQEARNAYSKFYQDLIARALVDIKDTSIFPAPPVPAAPVSADATASPDAK